MCVLKILRFNSIFGIDPNSVKEAENENFLDEVAAPKA